MNNIFDRLVEFSPKKKDDYIEITIPIVLMCDGGLLDLKISKTNKGYEISFLRDLFIDANDTQEYYYNVFNKYDKNYHYDIKCENNQICKCYLKNANIVVAISEFIKFFSLFDDFIINNDVIGHEENFVL